MARPATHLRISSPNFSLQLIFTIRPASDSRKTLTWNYCCWYIQNCNFFISVLILCVYIPLASRHRFVVKQKDTHSHRRHSRRYTQFKLSRTSIFSSSQITNVKRVLFEIPVYAKLSTTIPMSNQKSNDGANGNTFVCVGNVVAGGGGDGGFVVGLRGNYGLFVKRFLSEDC